MFHVQSCHWITHVSSCGEYTREYFRLCRSSLWPSLTLTQTNIRTPHRTATTRHMQHQNEAHHRLINNTRTCSACVPITSARDPKQPYQHWSYMHFRDRYLLRLHLFIIRLQYKLFSDPLVMLIILWYRRDIDVSTCIPIFGFFHCSGKGLLRSTWSSTCISSATEESLPLIDQNTL